LAAATFEHVCAEIEDPRRLGGLLNAQVGPDWPPGEYDRGAQEFFRNRLREGGSSVVGWYGWYALRRGRPDEQPILIGAGGFIGPPNKAGEVEMGFSIVTQWRGYGYATEMVKALIARALADSRVHKIVAHTIMDNFASCRVLEKAGFRRASVAKPSGDVLFEQYPPQ
jgi:ribosomal-protein-alanine N-acetyltransferase